jgi:hypothetical protein
MKSPAPKADTTPLLARQVIDLYALDLAEVRFPDLDLSALLYAQSELHAAQLEIERVEQELVQARSIWESRAQVLTQKAERALAYARIYAQGDAELAPRIADIGRRKPAASADAVSGTGGEAGAREPRKRGRKPKAESPSELFADPAPPM